MKVLCFILSLAIIISAAGATSIEQLIQQYSSSSYSAKKPVDEDPATGSKASPQKTTDPAYKGSSKDRGMGFYFDDDGGVHWFFSFGSNSSLHPGHNPNLYSPGHSYDLYDVVDKYDLYKSKIVPLVYQGQRIGAALVTGSRHDLTDVDAVVMKYEQGNIVLNIPVDVRGYYVDDVNVFALQKVSYDPFPFYRKKARERSGGN